MRCEVVRRSAPPGQLLSLRHRKSATPGRLHKLTISAQAISTSRWHLPLRRQQRRREPFANIQRRSWTLVRAGRRRNCALQFRLIAALNGQPDQARVVHVCCAESKLRHSRALCTLRCARSGLSAWHTFRNGPAALCILRRVPSTLGTLCCTTHDGRWARSAAFADANSPQRPPTTRRAKSHHAPMHRAQCVAALQPPPASSFHLPDAPSRAFPLNANVPRRRRQNCKIPQLVM